MRHKIVVVGVLFLATLFSACGSDPAKSDAAAASKSLFSLWRQDNSSAMFDFTGVNFNTSVTYTFFLTGGGICSCGLVVVGDNASGVISFSSCTFNAQGSGASDPGCNTINGNYTYTKSGVTLSVCQSSTCNSYH